MLAAGRRSLEPIRPSGCSSWSPSKRRPPLGEGPWWRSCPNLLQRPGSSRGAREETLIFRASSHGRSRRGAPLQQIWTRSRPGSSQKPHPPHRAKGFTPGRTGTGGGGGAGVAVPPVRPGAHRNRAVLRPDARRERPIVLAGIRIQRDPRGQGFPPRPRGPLSSRGSAPGFPFRGNSLLRQSDRPRAP